jgi:hypothetical protein
LSAADHPYAGVRPAGSFLSRIPGRIESFAAGTLFFRGGAYNAAIARMVLATALWLSIRDVGGAWSWDYYVASFSSWGWNPKGLVKIVDLFTNGPPSQALVVATYLVAKWSIVLMFVGLFSRISSIVAALSATLFCTYMCSFGPFWSHAFNVQLLAALSFMFGRSGDVLSVDALIRWFRGRPSPVKVYDGRYWWPVLFAELATHMFMFGAFFQKWTNGNGIWWALSDNLRNSLAVAWGLYRFDPPAITLWVMDHAWVYKTAGTLQLFAQFSTVICLFLVRWPVPRMIIGGSFFFLEILGLSRLFEFWHPFWVPLCLLSVDWEWLFRKIRGGAASSWNSFALLMERQKLARAYDLPRPYRAAVYAFFVAFFGYYAANIVWSLGEKHLNYPFSSMAFYSENRDTPPYDEPGYYLIYRGFFEAFLDGEDTPVNFTRIPSDAGDMLARLSGSEADARAAYTSIDERIKGITWLVDRKLMPGQPVAAMRTYRQIVAVPPTPRPALPLATLHSGLLFASDAKGFRGVDNKLEWDTAREQYVLRLRPYGFKEPKLRVLVRRNVREKPAEIEPTELAGEWDGGDLRVNSTKQTDGSVLYTLIEVTDPVLGVTELYAGPENFQTYR